MGISRPLLLSGPMVRAVLEGRKVMTRRPVRRLDRYLGIEPMDLGDDGAECYGRHPHDQSQWCFGYADYPTVVKMRCPYGQPGDELWVRETWSVPAMYDDVAPTNLDRRCIGTIRYAADGHTSGRPRQSIHLPRWASRIEMTIGEVRVERLWSITQDDAVREGLIHGRCCVTTSALRDLVATAWDQLYAQGRHGWPFNPMVWVVTWARVRVRVSGEWCDINLVDHTADPEDI